jgi:hypothetical protein
MDADSRWCKAIEVHVENETFEILGGPRDSQVLTLTMHAMFPGKSVMDTTFAAEADEKLKFMFPMDALPMLMNRLLAIHQAQ